MDIYLVELTKKTENNLEKLPRWIVRKFKKWVEAVEIDGTRKTREVKSYHDEPLQEHALGSALSV